MATKKSIFQIITKGGDRSPALACTTEEFRHSLKKVYSNDEALQSVYVLVVATLEDGDTGVVDRRGISRFPLVTGYTFCGTDHDFFDLNVPVLDDVVVPS